jgi:hypothetical protein
MLIRQHLLSRIHHRKFLSFSLSCACLLAPSLSLSHTLPLSLFYILFSLVTSSNKSNAGEKNLKTTKKKTSKDSSTIPFEALINEFSKVANAKASERVRAPKVLEALCLTVLQKEGSKNEINEYSGSIGQKILKECFREFDPLSNQSLLSSLNSRSFYSVGSREKTKKTNSGNGSSVFLSLIDGMDSYFSKEQIQELLCAEALATETGISFESTHDFHRIFSVLNFVFCSKNGKKNGVESEGEYRETYGHGFALCGMTWLKLLRGQYKTFAMLDFSHHVLKVQR